MKLLDIAKSTDIDGIIFRRAMLAYLAVLYIRFMNVYLSIAMITAIYLSAILYCPNARKRAASRIIHQRRFALFKINPDSRAGLSGK